MRFPTNRHRRIPGPVAMSAGSRRTPHGDQQDRLLPRSVTRRPDPSARPGGSPSRPPSHHPHRGAPPPTQAWDPGASGPEKTMGDPPLPGRSRRPVCFCSGAGRASSQEGRRRNRHSGGIIEQHTAWSRGEVWSSRRPVKAEVAGSNPVGTALAPSISIRVTLISPGGCDLADPRMTG